MASNALEERVAVLERQIHQLLTNGAGGPNAKDWRRTLGAFTDDDLMKRVFAEGRKIRIADRSGARRPKNGRRQAQS